MTKRSAIIVTAKCCVAITYSFWSDNIWESFLEKSEVEANIYLDAGAEYCPTNGQLVMIDEVAKIWRII